MSYRQSRPSGTSWGISPGNTYHFEKPTAPLNCVAVSWALRGSSSPWESPWGLPLCILTTAEDATTPLNVFNPCFMNLRGCSRPLGSPWDLSHILIFAEDVRTPINACNRGLVHLGVRNRPWGILCLSCSSSPPTALTSDIAARFCAKQNHRRQNYESPHCTKDLECRMRLWRCQFSSAKTRPFRVRH